MLPHSFSSSAGHYIYHIIYIYIYINKKYMPQSFVDRIAVSVGVCRAAISGTLLSYR